MRKKITIIAASIAMFALGTSEILLSVNGHDVNVMEPNGITGRSGSGTLTCTECHAGTVNPTGGNVTITSPDMPNFKYQLGKQYNIVVTITDSKAKAYGLNFSAVNAAKAKVGTFVAGTGSKVSAAEITHTAPATSNSFTFKWTAPATAPAGNDITLFVAGLAANKDNENTGDVTYTSKQVITLNNIGVNNIANVLSSVAIYPNPVSDAINLSYSLAEANTVNIKLENLKGQTIADLLTENQKAGEHKKILQLPISMSAGVYLLSIHTNNRTNYSKIVVTK